MGVELIPFDFPPAPKRQHLTHRLFRYPARFHPPVVAELLERYTLPGQRILDPFSGSGTTMIEAAARKRAAIGADVDPVAALISRAKATPLSPSRLTRSLDLLVKRLIKWRRTDSECEDLKFSDIALEDFHHAIAPFDLPAIPNLHHWFRRYVIVDLLRIRHEIEKLDAPASHRRFLLLCFASIIRAASNADPVPVSGLEVTAHMLQLEAKGRIVNTFALLDRALERSIAAMEEYSTTVAWPVHVSVLNTDVSKLARYIRVPVDAVLTSPPYHGAVDYYRRHQLEMFWLRLTKSQQERLSLLQQYIGRPHLALSHPYVALEELKSPSARRVYSQMLRVSRVRAAAFKHYCVSMTKAFTELAKLLTPGAPALFVVGHSTWNNTSLNTSDLFVELAKPLFELTEQLWYPITNRHMSYKRHNGANIDREYVLVLRRTDHESK